MHCLTLLIRYMQQANRVLEKKNIVIVIVDILSRAYLQIYHKKHKNMPEYQIFQLSQEQQLLQEIADINEVDYMCLSEGTRQQIK